MNAKTVLLLTGIRRRTIITKEKIEIGEEVYVLIIFNEETSIFNTGDERNELTSNMFIWGKDETLIFKGTENDFKNIYEYDSNSEGPISLWIIPTKYVDR